MILDYTDYRQQNTYQTDWYVASFLGDNALSVLPATILCIEAVEVTMPWVDDVEAKSPWVDEVQVTCE